MSKPQERARRTVKRRFAFDATLTRDQNHARAKIFQDEVDEVSKKYDVQVTWTTTIRNGKEVHAPDPRDAQPEHPEQNQVKP